MIVTAASVLGATLSAMLAAADSTPSCRGRRIAAVAIDAERPAFRGTASKWRMIAHAFGLHHATTRPEVIRAFSYVHAGEECSDEKLAETARALRSLPFLADATVRAAPADEPDSGMVVVEIETKDEAPVLIAGALHHSVPSALSVGNENLFGLGTSVMVGGASNSPYRSSAFATATSYGALGDLTLASADVARDRLGDHVQFGVSRLLLSDLQRIAWNATFRSGRDYPIIVRPVGDDQSVEVRDSRWSVAAIVRANLGRTPILFGPVALDNSVSPTATSLVVSDSGAVVENDSALLARFRPFHAMRIGALLGARRVRFVTRSGFDALFAPQDLMVGWQVGALTAPGMTGGRHDVLVAPSIYLGVASQRSAVLADGEGEVRRDFGAGGAASTILNVHSIGYFKATDRVLFSVEHNFSAIDGAVLPTQLSMSDARGGPRGFGGSNLVGSRRNLVRLRARLAAPALIHGADLGIALFADAGWLSAGNVPSGTSASARSVGFSLIGSYPTHSKRTYRLDVAFPSGGAIHGVQVRFINGDPTSNFSVEPGDVTQARMAPIPSSLFTWPGR